MDVTPTPQPQPQHWKREHIPDEMVVRAAAQFHGSHFARKPRRSTQELLELWTNAPRNVVVAAMERAHEHGVIDYGISLATAWPMPSLGHIKEITHTPPEGIPAPGASVLGTDAV